MNRNHFLAVVVSLIAALCMSLSWHKSIYNYIRFAYGSLYAVPSLDDAKSFYYFLFELNAYLMRYQNNHLIITASTVSNIMHTIIANYSSKQKGMLRAQLSNTQWNCTNLSDGTYLISFHIKTNFPVVVCTPSISCPLFNFINHNEETNIISAMLLNLRRTPNYAFFRMHICYDNLVMLLYAPINSNVLAYISQQLHDDTEDIRIRNYLYHVAHWQTLRNKEVENVTLEWLTNVVNDSLPNINRIL